MEDPGLTLRALEDGEGRHFAEGRSDRLLTCFEALVADPTRTVLEKGTWLVALARLVLEWSQDLVASLDPTEGEQETPSDQFLPRGRGQARAEARALATWLDARPVLGRDVFVASTPSAQPHAETSLAAFLVASLVAFDGRAGSVTVEPQVWRVVPFDFPDLRTAREQLLLLLEEAARVPLASVTDSLERLSDDQAWRSGPLCRRATLAGSFLASLELAKQGEAVLTQDGLFADVFVERVVETR
ncbi:hypothetical protein [Acetobacter vaccinii]|uniref:Segregation/condensation protein A n=1 Tax=Acetobacter vaccinii TaxID=2592655 RepID=A0A5C1YUN6_9PROT|nr:hypothetical protein [Acetobacter vaccinii]QEO18967.1 hypothetical protein FLP30_13970 [Acetobacter vaccinii]